MKSLYNLCIIFVLVCCLVSCKKDQGLKAQGGMTTLNIVNAVNGSNQLISNINNNINGYFTTSNNGVGAYFGSSYLYNFTSGGTTLSVRDIADTTKEIYGSSKLEFDDKSIHSLFLAGTTDNPESVLTNDIIPDYSNAGHGPSDSVGGLRFINLLSDAADISVNLVGNANGSEVSALPYKSITDFKTYPATSSISDYQFEFRDAASGDLLSTYTVSGVNNGTNGDLSLNTFRYKNQTIVLYGNATTGAATFAVNNF